jgi:hypothetical protein
MQTWNLGRAVAAVAALALLCAGGTATALQFTPSATARIHNITSGQPGVPWNTGGLGVNGFLDYSAATTSFTMDFEVLALNYYDPLNGGCPTDVGSNCNFAFGPNLEGTLTADLYDITVTPISGSLVNITVRFQTTGGLDLQVFDPTDLGAGSVLDASWQAGTFLGNPTTGLQASVVFNTGTMTALGSVTGTGFLNVSGGLYASLFPAGIGINVGSFFDFTPALNSILATAIGTGNLPNFTSEAQGQTFAVAAGQFVPEPGLAWLLGCVGVLLVGVRRRGA